MNKGQALVTGAMTLAGVFASLAGGVLLDALGVSKVLMIGAIISVLGTICMFVSVEDVDKHERESWDSLLLLFYKFTDFTIIGE